MESDTKIVIEILTPLVIMMGWMWKNLSKKIDEVDSRLGKKIDEVDSRLGKKIDEVDSRLGKKIDENTKAIQNLDRRIQRIEDRLEFSNKVVYVQHEESKEN